MNGRDEPCEVEKDCSRAEEVMRRFEELIEKAKSMRKEIRILSELVTGSNGEREEKTPGGDKKDPHNILDHLYALTESMGEELVGIDLNLDHIKESVGTDRFEKMRGN